MMKKYLKLLAGAALALSLSGCGTWIEVDETAEVVAVYWHEGNRYSVALQDGDKITMKRLGYPMTRLRVSIFVGAEKTWYMCKGRWNTAQGGGQDGNYCELHLTSMDDITGADWNHGKFGRGSTKRIN